MLLKRQGSCQAEPHELAEWIDDTQSIDLSRVLQVLRVEHGAASLLRSPQHQSVPERELVQAMQVNGRKNVGQAQDGNVEFSQQLDLAAGNLRIDVELPGDRNEVLLQDLQRDDPRARQPVFRDQLQRAPLFRRRCPVVGVNQNIGVEEATSAHEFRFDRNASPASGPGPRGA